MHLRRAGFENLRMGITPWDDVDGMDVLRAIEEYGRLCYKSEAAITDTSAVKFVADRIKQRHIALLDHLHITAKFITDRGVSHEWLRHKLTEMLGVGCVEAIPDYDFAPMAVCQESSRYCNYMKSGGVVFIIPPWINSIPEGEYNHGTDCPSGLTRAESLWYYNKLQSEHTYIELLKAGWSPQQARGDLLISTKTEFIVTCSLTEWRHVMSQRTAKAAHPQMREIMEPQLISFRKKIPVIFDDLD